MPTERVQFVISAQDMASAKFNTVGRSIDDLDGKQKKLNTTSKETGSMFDDMVGDMKNWIAGISVMGFAKVVSDLNQVGMAAQGTKSIFASLAAEVGGADNLLSQLRSTTGNVVDDMTLMNSASQLMRMGLANSSDGVNELINMAVRLKQPTQTAQEAIENFSLMLANQSVARLDSFGISSGRVRARIEELIKSGQALNREQAFTMAVMEEGSEALDRLGNAIYSNDTAFNRMSVRIENARNDLAEFVAQGLEAGAMLVELFALMAENPESQPTQQVLDAGGTLFSPFAGGGFGFASLDIASQLVENQTGDVVTSGVMGSIMSGSQSFNDTMLARQQAEQRARGQTRFNLMMGGGIRNAGLFAQSGIDSLFGMGQQTADDRFNRFQTRFGEISNESYFGRGNMGLMTPESISSAKSGYDQLLAMQQELEEHPFVREQHVDAMERMVDQAKILADQAKAAEAAFENMSLSQMLGQENGGRLGELSDMVGALINDEGAAAEFQQTSDLATGRETDLSMAVQDDIAPTLARISEELGADVAVGAMDAVLRAIEEGQVAGLSQEAIIAAANSAIGFAEDSEGNMQPTFSGDVFNNMEMMGMPPGFGGGEDDASMLEEAQEISDVVGGWSADSFTEQMENNLTIANEFKQLLEQAGNARYEASVLVDVKFKYSDPRGQQMLQDQMTQVVNDNGGTVPEK